jgi:hypothetical protein
MATTQEEVIEALVRSGRLADDWPRRLTSWRALALLPPLASLSLGRGGWTYWWEEEDIIDRAMTVHDSLKFHRDADAALISIWRMGFTVPTEAVRDSWLRRLDKRTARYEELSKRHPDGGASHALAAGRAGPIARLLETRRKDLIPALEEVADLTYSNEFDATSAEEVFRGIAKLAAGRSAQQAGFGAIVDAVRVDFLIDYFELHGSNDAVGVILREASCAAIERAHDQWLAIWRAISQVLPEISSEATHITPERGLADIIGRYALPGLISRNLQGNAPRIDQTIRAINMALDNEEFRALFRRLAASSQIDAGGRAVLLCLINEIGRIWELNLFSYLTEPETNN